MDSPSIERLEPPPHRPGDPLYAAHRSDGRFFNPWSPFPHRLPGLLRFWLRPGPRAPAPPPHAPPRRRLPRTPADGDALLTWVGHCTFVLQEGADVVLTDPHWGTRSKVRRRRAAPGVERSALPDDPFAVVSHNHYDHLDRPTVSRLARSTRWLVPLGLGGWFRSLGHRHVVELDWWQRVRFGRWSFTCLPAQHWSFRLGQGRHRTLWCSWLVESPTRTYYFAGDSGYFDGFGEFGRRFAPIDVALLPIGTYLPRWQLAYQHMDPGEAYQACLDLGAAALVPMHWGTFRMGWDAPEEAPRALMREVARHGGDPGRVRTLQIGETWRVPRRA